MSQIDKLSTDPDAEQIRLLSIFHYVVAGIGALASLFPILHLVFGLVMVFAPETFNGSPPPPQFVGWLFAGVAALFMLMGAIFSFLTFLAGRFLSKRKHFTFCLVMAGVECIFFPFGTALGIFSLIVLLRPSVKPLFQRV